jgi:ribonuclease Z
MQHMNSFVSIGLSLAMFAGSAHGADIRVTLIGTSSPVLNIHRFGMSTLVEAGGQKLLFDAGRGAAMRLHQAKVPLRDITAIFITHLHSDHLAGFPDIYATAPLTPGGSRRVPFDIWGPQGIADVARGVQLMFATNNEIRVAEKDMVQEATNIIAHSLPAEGGLVYEKDGVKVSAFRVEHGHATAYGYRVEHGGHALVLSGDTTYSPNLAQHAKGVELLIHCVAIGSRRLEAEAPELVRPRYAHLASPEMAGRILNEVRPQQAVFAHISLISGRGIPRPTVDELKSRISLVFDGPFVIGEDLMSFTVTDRGVIAEPYSPAKRQQEPE